MAAKSDSFYFNTFAECAALAGEAAQVLHSVLTQFNSDEIDEIMWKLHEVEHKADEKKHDMLSALVKAFITPIERDDIIKLSQAIDDITDSVEDVVIQINMDQVKFIRPDSIEFSNLLIRCCKKVEELLEEFRNFKKSKTIKDIIIEINRLEEEGDQLYISVMKNLHATSKDPIEIIVWRDIYKAFENVCDYCEDVANIVESIVIGNL